MALVADMFHKWLKPIVPGKWFGLSRMTAFLALGFLATMVLNLGGALIIESVLGSNPPKAAFYPFAALMALGDIALVLAFISLVVGVIQHVRWLGAKKTADARTSRSAVESAASTAVELNLRLKEIYSKYNDALATRVRMLLQPDHYGRRNLAAAAQELSRFQSTVAVPTLNAEGFDSDDINAAFDGQKHELLKRVLDQAKHDVSDARGPASTTADAEGLGDA